MLFSAARWAYFDEQGNELSLHALTGHAYLVLVIGGVEACIPMEQRYLDRGYRVVFIGAEFEETFSVEIPEGPEKEAHTAFGFTDDRDVVALTREFRAAVCAGNFAPQVIKGEKCTIHYKFATYVHAQPTCDGNIP